MEGIIKDLMDKFENQLKIVESPSATKYKKEVAYKKAEELYKAFSVLKAANMKVFDVMDEDERPYILSEVPKIVLTGHYRDDPGTEVCRSVNI